MHGDVPFLMMPRCSTFWAHSLFSNAYISNESCQRTAPERASDQPEATLSARGVEEALAMWNVGQLADAGGWLGRGLAR